MNLNQLKRNQGYHVQIVPVACRLNDLGIELPPIDDDWLMEEVNDEHVRISNVRTGHIVVLGKDHIHNFSSNPQRSLGDLKYGFLNLHVQVFIQGNRARYVPNLRPGERVAPPAIVVTEKSVTLDYVSRSGLEQKLNAEGFVLQWCGEPKLAERIEFGGWEIVKEPDGGGLASFRVKDRICDLILIKKRAT